MPNKEEKNIATLSNKNEKNSEERIHHPHDSAFKAALSDKRVAIDFLKNHLSKEVYEKIDLDTLELQNASFIDEELKSSEADVLYKALMKSEDGVKREIFIYTLLEHQSTVDKWHPLRIVKYMVRIWEDFRKQNPGSEALPIILPIIVYNGPNKYNASTSFTDLFGDHKKMAENMLLNPFSLLDLNTIEDEEIKHHYWCGLLELFMKKSRNSETLALLKEAKQLIDALSKEQNASGYLIVMVRYLISQTEAKDLGSFLEGIHGALPKKVEEEIMNVAQQLEQRGMQKGIELGREEGINEGVLRGVKKAAIALMNQFHDKNKVATLLDISESDLNKILDNVDLSH